MAVRIPATAAKLRASSLHCAQFVQSHALSFFHLSAPDLLLGMDSDPATRNVLGLIAEHPELARDGIELRKFGQQVIEMLAKERVHPSWIVAGGVTHPLDHRDARQDPHRPARGQGDRPPHARACSRGRIDQFGEEIEIFGNVPTMYAGPRRPRRATCSSTTAACASSTRRAEIVADRSQPEDYADVHRRGERCATRT